MNIVAEFASEILTNDRYMITATNCYTCNVIKNRVGRLNKKNYSHNYEVADEYINERAIEFLHMVREDPVATIGFTPIEYGSPYGAFVHTLSSNDRHVIDKERFITVREAWLQFLIDNSDKPLILNAS